MGAAVYAAEPTLADPPDEQATVISVRDLRKSYGKLEAVKGIDLSIKAGEIFGLIGPDGAGKTSVFQILGGVMAKTGGEVSIYGKPERDARSYVGYLTQVFSLYQDLTVEENLRYIGELRLLKKDQIETRGQHYLKLFDLAQFTQRLAGRLSGGMKQKLALACALIAEPKVLLLDEPTTGVDPVSRREFWDTLVELSSRGMTMVVATPYLDEAERCSRVGLMFDGRIVQLGTPKSLRDSLGMKRLELRAGDLGRTEELLSASHKFHDIQRFGDRLDLMVRDADAGQTDVREILKEAAVDISSIDVAEPTLENCFVSALRDLEGDMVPPQFPRRRKFQERPPNAVAIGAEDVSKYYGDFTAVDTVNLSIKYGEIYGLLGANGAGKTTTIKMLCGLLEPSDGIVELAGKRGGAGSADVRKRVGYMSQKFSLYDDLTIDENLDFFAGVYGVATADRDEKKRWIYDFSGLTGRGRMLTGELPGGWKQRVAFGAAIMHEPSVLFLDEPTSGVDPLARRAFWKMINELADHGVAILVTTHYLEEAEQCNNLGFMVAGRVVAEGTPTGIKAAQGGHLIELITDKPQQASNLLKTEMDRWRVSLFGDRLHVVIEGDIESGIADLKQRLANAGIAVERASEQVLSLEDVFISIVEQQRGNIPTQ
ncbi:MAG: ATP-binding cassette domain-containing protein [Acidobacteriota bacterium]